MKKILLAILVFAVCSAKSQNVLKNPNLSSGWQSWDASGCMPVIGAPYGYTGSPYWFESTYGGVSTTNLVAEVGGGGCLQQILPLLKGASYQINFKAARRCESDNPDLPPTLSIRVKVMGTTSFTVYSEVIYNYTNTTWNWTNETQSFTIPAGSPDNQVYFSISAYNVVGQFGVIVDDVSLSAVPPFTVSGPTATAINTPTNWSVSNLPATTVTYNWSFPGATPSSSTSANPTNVQWSTTGVKTVSCILNNGSGDLVTITKNINVAITLPVSLVSFNAAAKNNSAVELKWITAEEINSDYFEVYRSKNAVDWEPAGKLNSQGVNGGSYTLTDLNPVAGLNYYKLKQVDKSGAFKYSNIVKVNLNGDNRSDMYVYPTVVKSTLTYVVLLPKAGKLNVLLTDVSGKRISNTAEYFANGTTQKTIDVSKLATGAYLLTVMDGSGYKKSVTFNKN